jgi:hypothetical protein
MRCDSANTDAGVSALRGAAPLKLRFETSPGSLRVLHSGRHIRCEIQVRPKYRDYRTAREDR